jgi:hypothetical protein
MFKLLEEQLRKEFALTRPDLVAQMPMLPKRQLKFFVDHLEQNFIDERKQGLENFCRYLVDSPVLANHPAVLKFFLTA